MVAVLRVKDENGNVIAIPAIRGPQGPAGEVDYSRISEHNTAEDSHNDIRLLIEGLTTRLNAVANSSDTDLDQLAEIVAYIKNNKSLIDGITTDKVNVTDIINNLTTNVANKPLSAAQGVVLKALIDGIVVPTKPSEVGADPAGTASTAVTNHNSAADAHSALFAKKANDYSIELYNGNGGVNPVKFMSVNYSTCNSENGVAVKVGMVCGHGNGSSYAFLQDAIFKVGYDGTVSVDNFKYYGAAATYDGSRQYGDIFWVIDTTNKIVDFYCVMGQYSRLNMIPYKRVTYSSGGVITQYTTATVYSSGTKVWGNNSEIALMSDIPAVPTKTEQWTFTYEDGTTATKEVYVK